MIGLKMQFFMCLKAKINKKIIPYLILLFCSIVSCILRYPDFETVLWSASDTNYQCLMNAKAMIEAKEDIDKTLPVITFSEETDYGLEYSSGAFDKETGKIFYYVSFPAFPFVALTLFFKVSHLPITVKSLYLFSSGLLCISTVMVAHFFVALFGNRILKNRIIYITGITYLLSTEIMHSMGLTYWGQNWYMILFPILGIVYLKLEADPQKNWWNYVSVLICCFLLLQTEWSAYFVAAALMIVGAVKFFRLRDYRDLIMTGGVLAEVLFSIVVFIGKRASVVGIKELLSVLTQRTMGRSRITDYSLFAVEKSLGASFGALLILVAGYGIWRICESVVNKKKLIFAGKDSAVLFLMILPLVENHIFTNHALTYTMDRMKWFFPLQFILLWFISDLLGTQQYRKIIYYTMTCCMCVSMGLYIWIDSDYKWNDDRLKASVKLEEYIKSNYGSNVLGQLGNNSVWGYSKLLFGHGIVKETDLESLIKRADKYEKRYAVALNDLDLAYTQKWYSSAIIYDTEQQRYFMAGSIKNQYLDKIEDIQYLKYASYIDFYQDDFEHFVQRLIFSEKCTMSDKKRAIGDFVQNRAQGDRIIYFTTEMEEIPHLIMVDNQNTGEWKSGTSSIQNRLIFLNTDGNRQLLKDANALSVEGKSGAVKKIFAEGDFIYIDLETEDISDYSYPNTISIEY